MGTDDRATAGPPHEPSVSRQQLALAFVVFLFLLAQPVVVFALAMLAPDLPTFVVIGVGTVVLAASVANQYLRLGGSIDRLADFVLVLAGVQVVLALLAHLSLRAVVGEPPPLAMLAPALVVAGYPIAYYVVYRGPPIEPLSLGSKQG